MVLFGRRFMDWQQGKKTYITAGIIVAAGVAQGLGVHIPEWAMWVLGGGTIIAHRAAVSQVMYDVIDTKNTLRTVVDMVSTPVATSKGN